MNSHNEISFCVENALSPIIKKNELDTTLMPSAQILQELLRIIVPIDFRQLADIPDKEHREQTPQDYAGRRNLRLYDDDGVARRQRRSEANDGGSVSHARPWRRGSGEGDSLFRASLCRRDA